MALTAATSPSSLPQSSTGRFEVSSVLAALITPHHDFQQILGGGVRQLAHAEVVDDEQRHGGDRFHVFLARAVGNGVGEFIEQDVCFAIQHAIALLNGSLSDGLRQDGSCPCLRDRGTAHLRACR